MPYHVHVLHFKNLFVISKRHGEQKLVILTPVQSSGYGANLHLICQGRRLVVYRNPFLVNSAPRAALLADVQQFGRQAVGNVNHRRWQNAGFGQTFRYVAARLGLELALQQVFMPRKVGLHGFERGVCAFQAFAFVFEHCLFALEQLQPHVSRAQVAAHANKVCIVRSASVNNTVARRRANTRYRYGQPCE